MTEGNVFSPHWEWGGHLTVSREISGCHNFGEGFQRHLVQGG